MEEIEKIHNRGKNKKKSKLVENFGFKKDVMNFLTCLRNIRFDFRCFGAFPQPDMLSDDEEEDEEEDDEFEVDEVQIGHDVHGNNFITKNTNDDDNSKVFSKWFMLLQENQVKNITSATISKKIILQEEIENDENAPAVPPANALLLMRCRSAPAKSWLEEREIEAKEEEKTEEVIKKEKDEEKVKKNKRESLGILMKYDADFYNLSSEIAQETWVGGGFKDAFSRSRSWRR